MALPWHDPSWARPEFNAPAPAAAKPKPLAIASVDSSATIFARRRRLMAELYDLHDGYRDRASSRCSRCGHFTSGNAVKVAQHPGALPHYQGLQRCGLLWECPTCSARIKVRRAAEVLAVVEWHTRRYGRETAVMATFTLSHMRRDNLGQLRRGMAKAWQRVQRGAGWKAWKARVGFAGSIRALEVTHGWSNGWHPHLHVVILLRGEQDAWQLRAWLYERWRAAVVAELGAEHAPLEFDPHDGSAVGVDVRRCNKAEYVAKLGLEVASPNTKRGRGEHRTPLEILADFVDAGTAADLQLYLEYVNAMKGARQLTWSKGLHAMAGVVELTDQEIVDGEDGGEPIAIIARGEWSGVRRIRGAKSAILEVAEQHGADGVYAMVDALLGRPPAPGLPHRVLEVCDQLIAIRFSRRIAVVK